ncbi:MAG TPA: glycine--tRNA ligase subunit beta [Steroidobacteraceae bacterium]|nr:glycine--tRNA ligase subunit beta [Steroidobacteraceae bacterium]
MSDRADFLVELGTEELPPKALLALSEAFRDGLVSRIDAAGLAHGKIEAFATPRRLAVRVKRLALQAPDQKIQRRGPPVAAAFDKAGAPTRAAQAFAQSCGVALEELSRETDPKGNECLSFSGVKPGAAASALLPTFVSEALDALPIPKRMRWGAGEAQFVRPVHWLVLLLGSEVIPATILDATAGNETRGHRFHAVKALRIGSPAAYEKTLEKRGRVLADFAARRERIRAGAMQLAVEHGGKALISAELLDEVTALNEWPVSLAGRFEERFLALPRELLISVLQDHQRYFPVEGADGRLLPLFITHSNVDSADMDVVRSGNERVVRPRLSDAAFFWEQDRKTPLASRLAALDAVTFQAQLGSIGDKVRRVSKLAQHIAARIGGDAALAARAATLAKCDLVTNLVGEFPELQGLMGRYYATADGENAEVASAIAEHYQPRGAGDALPASKTGLAVALADKLDTLTGIFAIGQKPTGTKDPFALRRAAIGINRMIFERALPLDVVDLIEESLRAHTVFEAPSSAGGKPLAPRDVIATQVYDYLMERQRNAWLEPPDGGAPVAGITPEACDAVIATRPRSPLDFDARLRALLGFLQLPEAASLTAANKRIGNLLKKSAGGAAVSTTVDASKLSLPAERDLFAALQGVNHSVPGHIAGGDYAAAFTELAQLRPAVDAFFDQVMVMDPDPALRANRLAMLNALQQLFGGIADLSRLPG